MSLTRCLAVLAVTLCAASVSADDSLSGEAILGPAPTVRVESLRTRFSYLDQTGRGYQSQAGPLSGPGSEQLTVLAPMAELTVRQGASVTHRLAVPVDIVSAASPDAVDAMSSASRWNEAASLDLTTTYQATPHSSAFVRGLIHLEENFRAYGFGTGFAHGFAEDNTTLAVSLNTIIDWFDTYDIQGFYLEHVWRTTTNANAGVTQLLSPTTVANLSYGVTVQHRHLGVTTNSVPLADLSRGPELLPSLRHRHAFAGQLVQWLPWNAALHASYRLYVDNWGITAHTLETQLYQRLTPQFYLRASYRLHQQSAADFFSTFAMPSDPHRTADSDLADFTAHEGGGKLVLELGDVGGVREVTIDIGADRYIRSNDLRVSLYSCGLGLRF